MLRKNLVSVFLSCVSAFVLTLAFNQFKFLYSINAYYSVVYFALTCLALNFVYAFNARSKTFTDLLFAGIIIRLLLALIVILFYAIKFSPDFRYFAIHFICHYILFTIFEIRYLFQLIKNNAQKQP